MPFEFSLAFHGRDSLHIFDASASACEAGISIKPGVKRSGTPGIQRSLRTVSREAGDKCGGETDNYDDAVTRSAGSNSSMRLILGLTPQALCLRLLRRLRYSRRAMDISLLTGLTHSIQPPPTPLPKPYRLDARATFL